MTGLYTNPQLNVCDECDLPAQTRTYTLDGHNVHRCPIHAPKVTTAPGVSARLRRAGLTTTPNYSRPGILVSKGWRRGLVELMCVQDRDRDADYQADLVEAELATWDQYTYFRKGHQFSIERKP